MEKTRSINMKINKFDGKSNFSLWQARMKDVLIQRGLIDAHLMRGQADHHGGAGLKMAIDAGSEYHPHIPNR